MADLPPARILRRAPGPDPEGARWYDLVTLAHDERLLRRRRLVTPRGEGFLVDLPATTRVGHGDGFDLGDGRLIEVVAAEEPLIEVRGGDLARLAWHVGNRHAPCQVEPHRLLIPRDRVLRDMLLGLGGAVAEVSEPFHPEGGAYHGGSEGHSHAAPSAASGDLAGLAHDPL